MYAMSQEQQKILKEEFEKYKSGKSSWDGMITYEDRKKQHAFADFAKDLIIDVFNSLSCGVSDLKHLLAITYAHVTDLEKLLEHIDGLQISSEKKNIFKNRISHLLDAGIMGYTATRDFLPSSPTESEENELKPIINLLRDISNEQNDHTQLDIFNKYMSHIELLRTKNIIYPWLHYINPNLFPIHNDEIKSFLNLVGFEEELNNVATYPKIIEFYHEISILLNEPDLGLIDSFIYKNKTLLEKLKGGDRVNWNENTNSEKKGLTDNEYNQKFKELCKNGRIKFITFHPSYGYEEFIEGITAKTTSDGKIIYYKKDGIFKKLCRKALLNILKMNGIDIDENDSKNWSKVYKKFDNHRHEIDLKKGKPFVLIIDEINRGNISKIFGELITLVENDKRLGGDCEITSILPYTRQRFGVPPNVYMIATMNTADRSIALLDVALRRRFKFVEMPPEFEKMKEEAFYREAGSGSLLHISVDALIRINDELCQLKRIGKDKRIGHSFFWNKINDDEVLEVWKTEILPLMEEYMYGDYDELQKCFGDKVIDKHRGISQKITIDILENSLKNNVHNWSPSSR